MVFGSASLFVISPPSTHGIRTRATIYFYHESAEPGNIGWALNVGGLNLDGIHVVGYADDRYFETMYTPSDRGSRGVHVWI